MGPGDRAVAGPDDDIGRLGLSCIGSHPYLGCATGEGPDNVHGLVVLQGLDSLFEAPGRLGESIEDREGQNSRDDEGRDGQLTCFACHNRSPCQATRFSRMLAFGSSHRGQCIA